MGKTALALNIASNVAQRNDDVAVVIFSLEMPKDQLMTQNGLFPWISGNAKSSYGAFKSTSQEWADWNKAISEVGQFPIYIDDVPGINLLEIRARLRELERELAKAEGEK